MTPSRLGFASLLGLGLVLGTLAAVDRNDHRTASSAWPEAAGGIG